MKYQVRLKTKGSKGKKVWVTLNTIYPTKEKAKKRERYLRNVGFTEIKIIKAK